MDIWDLMQLRFRSMGSGNGIFWIRFAVAFGLTIFMAHVSYHYFEKYFLKLKTRFTNS